MHTFHNPWVLALFALTLNLPFGYWRASCRKWSFAWFVSIHAPVILAIAVRFSLGVGFHLDTIPLYVLAFTAGQSLGARSYRKSRCQPSQICS
ncbi:MAG: hypothetical protein WCL16_03305 [bacterium]